MIVSLKLSKKLTMKKKFSAWKKEKNMSKPLLFFVWKQLWKREKKLLEKDDEEL